MIILASKSLRRQELLKLVGINHKVVESNFDESTIKNIDPNKVPLLESENKAKIVAKKYVNDIVIGADTGVLIENTLLGKPKDKDDAYRMLKMLSGKTHKVITGVTIISPKKTYKINSISKVTFFELSDEEIYNYISLEEPYDKAGAYGIQGFGATLIKKIDGDYFTIMGLPLAKVYRTLKKII